MLEFFGVGDGEVEIVLFNGFVVVVLFSVLEREEKILCYYILRNIILLFMFIVKIKLYCVCFFRFYYKNNFCFIYFFKFKFGIRWLLKY